MGENRIKYKDNLDRRCAGQIDSGSLHMPWESKMESEFAMLCWYGVNRQIVGEEENAIINCALLDTDCGEFGDDDRR